MKRIYLDYAATTPIDQRVAKAMREFESESFGNPSSMHREGQIARGQIDTARETIADFISAKAQEIIFTSGATEANNLAIQGTVSYYIQKYQIRPHVITTKLEHQSVYNTVKELASRGVIEASFISPSSEGLIRADDVIKEIKNNTVLVSTIFVSNEIGSILPVRELGTAIAEVNKRLDIKIMYHIDAVQAAQFLNCNVEKLGCDLLTLSAHKIYGPKGIGALYVRTGVKILNLSFGGSQEYGLRPGTQNTSGIIGFTEALKNLGTLEERQAQATRISQLRDALITEVLKIPDVILNGPARELRVANNMSFTIFHVDQDALITALDLAGLAASTGSACVSGSSEPSYVIEALRKISNQQAATVRLTLGKDTTEREIQAAAKILDSVINQLRHENK